MEHVVKQKQLPVLDLEFVKQKKVSVEVDGGKAHLIFFLQQTRISSLRDEILIESLALF